MFISLSKKSSCRARRPELITVSIGMERARLPLSLGARTQLLPANPRMEQAKQDALFCSSLPAILRVQRATFSKTVVHFEAVRRRPQKKFH